MTKELKYNIAKETIKLEGERMVDIVRKHPRLFDESFQVGKLKVMPQRLEFKEEKLKNNRDVLD